MLVKKMCLSLFGSLLNLKFNSGSFGTHFNKFRPRGRRTRAYPRQRAKFFSIRTSRLANKRYMFAYPFATSCASPGTLEALEDVSTDSAASFWAKLNPAPLEADLSFCARSAAAAALSGVLNVRPITSGLLPVFGTFALVDVGSERCTKCTDS